MVATRAGDLLVFRKVGILICADRARRKELLGGWGSVKRALLLASGRAGCEGGAGARGRARATGQGVGLTSEAWSPRLLIDGLVVQEELVLVLAPPAAQAGHAIACVLPCARGFLVATDRVSVPQVTTTAAAAPCTHLVPPAFALRAWHALAH